MASKSSQLTPTRFIQHHERSFPVFNTTDVIDLSETNPRDIHKAAGKFGGQILRGCRIFDFYGFISENITSLPELLSTTDSALNTAAAFCGARVVRHSWGLSQATSPGWGHHLLPDDFMLVAQVDYVPTERVDDKRLKKLTSELETINQGSSSLDYTQLVAKWSDANVWQFSIDSRDDSLVLHDIEPAL